jgi:hypothetical protein
MLDERQLRAADGRTVARRLLAAAGLSPGPRSVWRLCNAGAVDVYRAKLAVGSAEALIMPSAVPGRLAIHADDRPQPVTSRDLLVGEAASTRFVFRVAHELGHALTFDRQSGEIRRLTIGGFQEEAFCDDFAFGLLCPTAIRRIGPTPWLLRDVGRTTGVPLRLLAREVTALRENICIELWEPKGQRAVWAEGVVREQAVDSRCTLRGGWQLVVTAPRRAGQQLQFCEAA